MDPKGVNSVLKLIGKTIKDIPDSPENYEEMGTSEIAPVTLGPMAPVFERISVKILGARTDGVLYLRFNYNWKHPYGSNGYDVRIKSTDGGRTWVYG